MKENLVRADDILVLLGRSIVCPLCIWSVCLCVSMLGTRVSCAKTAEPIEMPFGADSCGFKELCPGSDPHRKYF